MRPYLSWNPSENVSREMIDSTIKKFESWDAVLAANRLESQDYEERRKALLLLDDPTIYFYAFFKDLDDKNEPFCLYPYQDVIINDHHRRIDFVAANQIGKSVLLCCKALHFALTRPGKTVLITSKTLPQSKDLIRQIKQLLQSCTLEYSMDVGDTVTKTEIYFKHKEYTEEGTNDLLQSRIICVPKTEAALGYAADLVLADELPFYEDGEYFYEQVLEPRTFSTKGQILVAGNPNGRQGIGWKIYNSPAFKIYRFNYLDKPGNTREEYDQLRRTRSREVFDSTVDAIFTEAQGAFFTLEERKRMQHERPNNLPSIITEPLYIFFDWAKSHDRTVRMTGIPIILPSGDMKAYIYESKEYPQGTPYDAVLEDLHTLISFAGPEKIFMVGWDNTGVGRGIEDFVKRVQELGIMCNPVEFSLENKSRIYVMLKFLVEQDRVDIPFVPECDKQLAQLRFQKSTRGYWQVHHENESDRDDFPDCLAGLTSLMIQPDNPPITATIVGEGEDVRNPEYESERRFLSTEERRAILNAEREDMQDMF